MGGSGASAGLDLGRQICSPGLVGNPALKDRVQGLALTCPPTGLYGPEGILPARRTLRPQGMGRWQQLWETPTLLWEAPRLGLDTAQGLELLSLLGTLLALGALLLSQLRHLLTYLLLWAAYLSVCQVSGAACCPLALLGTLSPNSLQALSPPTPPLPGLPCRHTPLLPDSPSPCRWARCFFISSGE